MICRVCVLESTNLLSIFETESNRAAIINQHFGFEPLNDDPITNMICFTCWSKIESFHAYYLNVLEAQLKFAELQLGYKIKEDDSAYEEVIERKEQFLFPFEQVDYKLPATRFVEVPETTVYITAPETPVYITEPEEVLEYSAVPEVVAANEEEKKNCKNEDHIADQECHDVNDVEDPDEEDSDDNNDDNYEPPIAYNDSDNDSDSFDSDDDKKLIELTKMGNQQQSLQLKEIKSEDTSSATSEPQNTENKPPPKRKGRKRKSDKPVPLNPRTSEYRKKSKQYDEEIAKRTKLKCDLCEKEFTIFNVLQRHYRAEHKVKGYVVCCTTKFYKRGMFLDHIMKHLEPDRLRCDICKKTYCSRRALHDHILVYHGPGDVKTFQCDQCPRKYLKQYQLNIHKKKHIPKDASQFKCEDCGKGFNTNSALQTHRRYIHENKYAHMCHICAKVLRSRTLYLKHKLVEHEGYVEPKQQCKECGAWLKNAFRLKLHMKKHKERESDFICNICGKSSPSSSALQSHVKYVHEAQRLHQCTFCNKAFKRAITLKEHLTTHTGDVLYTCPHCPKTFNSRANMHSHRKKKHPKEWEEARRIRGAPIVSIGKLRKAEDTNAVLDEHSEGNIVNSMDENCLIVNSVNDSCEIDATFESIESIV